MKAPKHPRYGPAKSTVICRAALSIGPLRRAGRRWQFGQRLFSPRTVNELIGRGLAVRDGDTVRAT